MAGRRAAAIAFCLVNDLADRLASAGVTPDCAPDLDQALALCWPLAKRLAKLERTGAKAGKTAARARAVLLDTAVAGWAGQPERQWAEFDAARWHVGLVARPAPDRDREAAAA